MKKIKVVNAGYTITVTSWENDGDNYNTKSIIVDTLEEAEAIYKLMQLCESKNNQPNGVIKLGNSCDFDEEQENLIVNFLKNNPVLYKNIDFEFGVDEDDDRYAFFDIFNDITCNLLGNSEYYACRVMEKCVVTYSPEDVYTEKIF